MTTFRTTFTTPYEQFAEREGQPFKVLGAVPSDQYDSEDVGILYEIEFADGTRIQAWPEEIET